MLRVVFVQWPLRYSSWIYCFLGWGGLYLDVLSALIYCSVDTLDRLPLFDEGGFSSLVLYPLSRSRLNRDLSRERDLSLSYSAFFRIPVAELDRTNPDFMLSLALPKVVPGIIFVSSISDCVSFDLDLFVLPNFLDHVSTMLLSTDTTTIFVISLSIWILNSWSFSLFDLAEFSLDPAIMDIRYSWDVLSASW